MIALDAALRRQTATLTPAPSPERWRRHDTAMRAAEAACTSLSEADALLMAFHAHPSAGHPTIEDRRRYARCRALLEYRRALARIEAMG